MQETQENRAITINILHNRSKASQKQSGLGTSKEGAEKGLILIFMLGIMLCNNFPTLSGFDVWVAQKWFQNDWKIKIF